MPDIEGLNGIKPKQRLMKQTESNDERGILLLLIKAMLSQPPEGRRQVHWNDTVTVVVPAPEQ